MSVGHRCNDTDGGGGGRAEVFGGKPVPVPFCLPQIPRDLAWKRGRLLAARYVPRTSKFNVYIDVSSVYPVG
jgi:hypothetical protein